MRELPHTSLVGAAAEDRDASADASYYAAVVMFVTAAAGSAGDAAAVTEAAAAAATVADAPDAAPQLLSIPPTLAAAEADPSPSATPADAPALPSPIQAHATEAPPSEADDGVIVIDTDDDDDDDDDVTLLATPPPPPPQPPSHSHSPGIKRKRRNSRNSSSSSDPPPLTPTPPSVAAVERRQQPREGAGGVLGAIGRQPAATPASAAAPTRAPCKGEPTHAPCKGAPCRMAGPPKTQAGLVPGCAVNGYSKASVCGYASGSTALGPIKTQAGLAADAYAANWGSTALGPVKVQAGPIKTQAGLVSADAANGGSTALGPVKLQAAGHCGQLPELSTDTDVRDRRGRVNQAVSVILDWLQLPEEADAAVTSALWHWDDAQVQGFVERWPLLRRACEQGRRGSARRVVYELFAVPPL